jgi:hypothetical protein
MNDLFYTHLWWAFAISFVAQCLIAFAGDALRRRSGPMEEAARKDFSTILPAALTLLALVIGFSFSMASGRYDQRKTLEEAEANAIGTEYVRAELLPAAQAAQTRLFLEQYTAQRILFYKTKNSVQLSQIAATTTHLQDELWATIAAPVITSPTPVAALVAAGMNDVLNSQGYTQASWWNRLPAGAWLLMIEVAVACNFIFGYGEIRVGRARLMVLPIIISIPFFLIGDLDSPRGGLIHVVPQNLIALYQTMQP